MGTRILRSGPFAPEVTRGKLAAYGMTPAGIAKVLEAADRSVRPVTEGLPWRVADVYAAWISGGYTIATRRGVQPGPVAAEALGAMHGAEGGAPFGDLDDAGSGDLMTVLGETGDTTEENYGYRVGLLDAYREAWESAAGRFYPIGG